MLKATRHRAYLFKQIWLGSTLLIVSGILFAQTPSTEQTEPPEEALCVFPPVENKPVQDASIPANRTQLQADEADMGEKNITHFSGNVIIQRGGRQIEADEAQYSQKEGNFDATGNVRFLTDTLEVKADKTRMNLKKNQGTLQQTHYRTLPDNARGSAEKMIIDGPDRLIMEDATYTTCPPGKTAWQLSASEITLDKQTRQGSATHAVIDFMGVPFLYLPYLRFPLGEERMSGILVPNFATSDERGTEISVPYYWDIAPDMDATITMHNMTRRGVMWENEFRYLNENSQGQIEFDYLQDDKVYGDERKRLKWHHQAQAGAGWSTVLDYQQVADNQHLVNFGGGINSSSTTHLEQRATLRYNAENWQFNALGQDFQTLSGTQPYRKLPQLTLASRLPAPNNRLNFNISSEWVRFDHTDASKPTADRSHIQPVVSLPLHSQAAFFIPKVTGYYTQYELSDNSAQPDKSPSRSLTIASLDTGLFLERDVSWGDTALIQTLEPRLFYVYAPYQDQDDLPVFDSGQTGFSFNSLFRENRFTGVDRVGDTNRLTVALTTRFLHQQTGAELFSASVGRIFYYADRRVSLLDKDDINYQVETENDTDYVARLAMRPASHWTLSSDIQWDDDTEQTRYSTSRLTYKRNKDHLLTFGYRYRRESLARRDIGLVWRFNPRWRFVAAQQYDLLNERNIETIYGLNYDSCCWGLRIVAREYYTGSSNGQDLYDNALYLLLELKGLANFGDDQGADKALRQIIPGYSQ